MRRALVERRTIARLQPDVIHETYYWGPQLQHPRALRLLTVYDMIHERFPGQFRADDRTSEAKRRAVAGADHIVCISESTRRDLMENAGRTRVQGFGDLPRHKPRTAGRARVRRGAITCSMSGIAGVTRTFPAWSPRSVHPPCCATCGSCVSAVASSARRSGRRWTGRALRARASSIAAAAMPRWRAHTAAPGFRVPIAVRRFRPAAAGSHGLRLSGGVQQYQQHPRGGGRRRRVFRSRRSGFHAPGDRARRRIQRVAPAAAAARPAAAQAFLLEPLRS